MSTSRLSKSAASSTRVPPSCQGCRARKLKCNRQRPCSNCQSRRLSCVYDGELMATPTRMPAPAPIYEPVAVGGEEGLLAQNRVMQARLEKLENTVFGATSHGSPLQPVGAEGSPSEPPVAEKSKGRTLWLETGWEQGTDVRLARALPYLTDRLQVAVLPNNQYAVDDHSGSRQIWVPAHDTTMMLLDTYETQMNPVQAILHFPILREKVKAFYVALNARHPVDVGFVALLLAICASVGFWDRRQEPSTMSSGMTDTASTFISKQALHAVENIRLSGQISVEAVQASILLTFHFCHLEGFTSRIRLLHSSAFTMARELGLHKIDAAGVTAAPISRSTIIETEVGRRVWWHLSSTDWLFAYTGGHMDGAYSIHPRHMKVNKPRNLSCEDLSSQNPDFERPDSDPTIVSFHLQRIKLASVCREVLEAYADLTFNLNSGNALYDLVPTLDNQFVTLIDSLPPFLRINSNSPVRSEAVGDAQLQIISQRALINLMIYTRRCKLHLPFLARFKTNPQYAFSRDVCLQSARTVLQVGHAFWLDIASGAFPAYFQLASNLQHIFFATVVLLMDLHVNECSDSAQIRQIHSASEVIRAARHSSLIGAVFYESLMDVLQKHQVELSAVKDRHRDFDGKDSHLTTTRSGLEGSEVRVGTPGFQPSGDKQINSDEEMTNTESAFDDVWQQFLDAGASMDVQSWDALMNDLDMRTA